MRCSGPVWSWQPPRMETAHHLWATCATAQQSTWGEKFFLCPPWTSLGSTHTSRVFSSPLPPTAVKIPALTTPCRLLWGPQSHSCSKLNKPCFSPSWHGQCSSNCPSWGPPLNSYQFTPILLVLGGPTLEVAFQIQSDKCQERGTITSLRPGHVNTPRDAAGLPFLAHFNQITHI